MAPSLTVATKYGPVVGYSDTYPLSNESTAKLDPAHGGRAPVLKWLGIPYGQAGRWERPSAPAPWTEPRECHEFGTMFPQPPSGAGELPDLYTPFRVSFSFTPLFSNFTRAFVKQSEDSFTLNVFAPEGTTADSQERIPVMFWIYGGSLNNGSSDLVMYDSTEWIRAQAEQGKKFIVVTANYRTNICGFFSGVDVKAADEQGLSGNYGAYDVIQALTWVQENIAAFGGDPGNVTLFGESAGSFLVSTLLVCGKRLFRRAIMQSGAAETMSTFPVERAYGAYSTILNLHGPGGATPQARINALRSVPINDLIKTHIETYAFTGISLTIEEGPHAIWPEKVIDRLERGEWDEWVEAVIIGTNEHEGSMFAYTLKVADSNVASFPLAIDQVASEAGYSALVSKFPPSLQTEINKKYLANGSYPTEVDLFESPASKVLGDQIFVVPAWRQAQALARQPNKKSGRKTRVYMYRFREVVDRLEKILPMKLGSMHALEIAFIFNLEIVWGPGTRESQTAAAMGSMWANFAINGNPDPNWRPFTSEQPSWLAIETGGKTENESLVDYQDTLVDFTGRNFAT
ncbi:BZ3500_MvSof-1268-A1-R1_Chr5-3g08259 [Microbotryum saponariae]|uniref:Carboxylic ester hydrolase n=1 Tax=Microbotryum saponariae TaxID=289078 RepID=A0A2X0NRA5_9BASI|nr:BZ3500_MvSof-1268-A1-R1_Chr5-3g08259 [Microbotryum saponariae]SDA08367.1 BZ3501_MvSof-1269-A2-R1_Chr5-3g07987 [Microbotryum saponariae]